MILQHLVSKLTRWFLNRLYTDLACGYDLVASIVSAGQWNSWVRSIIPYIQEDGILEIGFGTGHLQHALSRQFKMVYGLDASRHMAQIAHSRLSRNSHQITICQAQAQAIPMPSNQFSTIIATFPADFILQKASLAELRRVIRHAGKLIILASVTPQGDNLVWKAITWLFKITSQSDLPPEWITEPLRQAGFHPTCYWTEVSHARILIIVARPI